MSIHRRIHEYMQENTGVYTEECMSIHRRIQEYTQKNA